MQESDVRRSLTTISEALQADGYELSAKLEGGELHIQISATDGACEDCLIPQSLMREMVASAMVDAGQPLPDEDIQISYPGQKPEQT